MPKLQLQLVHKTQLADNIIALTYKSEQEINFTPGQFFSLEVSSKVYRAYSVFYYGSKAFDYYPNDLQNLESGKYISFMVNTRPGGQGSQYATNVKLGSTINAIGPNGKFFLEKNDKPKVFISTSTGLAPFVTMIEEQIKINPDIEIQVFFGVWTIEGDFCRQFFKKYPNIKVIICTEKCLEKQEVGLFCGRVTNAVPEVLGTKIPNYDYYLCGNPFMIQDMEKLLKENGATAIFKEQFGLIKK